MPQFELCCTVFALQLSSLLELVGVTDPESSSFFVVAFANWDYHVLLASSGLHIWLLNSSHSLPICLHIILCRQRQVMFPCLLCIKAICTHFILLFAVIFIYTLSTAFQTFLPLSFNECEYCEKNLTSVLVMFLQMFVNKHATQI